MRDLPLPRPALWLGLAGLLPFLLTALAVWLGGPATATIGLAAQAGYGATILSFLGAVHWGFALRAPPEEAGATAPRLALGVVPALLGWVALLLPAAFCLKVLAGGLLLTAAAETWAAGRGLVPMAYLRLRWALSLGAALCLLAVSALLPG